jgi:electron transfer flavoprotein alpha subunit
MKAEKAGSKTASKNIWIFVHHREGVIEDATFGLIGEARRVLDDLGGDGRVTAVALGSRLETDLATLGKYGIDKILYLESDSLSHYRGDLFAEALAGFAKKDRPDCIFLAQIPESSDLGPRVGALLEMASVTRAVDFTMEENGKGVVVRPVANGYLFEEVTFELPAVISFVPSVLSPEEPDAGREAEISRNPMKESIVTSKVEVLKRTKADPKTLELEDADIIVSGGRGVGKGEAFTIIFELAEALGGVVSGSRPVFDWKMIPFERQIGQTGKTVAPRLLIVCGISGANEYTAGMEKSQLVVAINNDPRARIFRFADLGVVGDVHEILPLLIQRLKGVKHIK